MGNAEENKAWIRKKMHEKCGDEGVERIDQQAHMLFIKKYASEAVVAIRFHDLITYSYYGLKFTDET